MPITLSKESKSHLITSIKRYFSENMEEEIGDLKSELLLDFVIKEVGPSIYNQAITDAQAYFQEKVEDLDGSCYEAEFSYWK